MVHYKAKNNAKSTVADSPLSAVGTTLNVVTGTGNEFPDTFPFVITLWDAVTYPDPGDDPEMEIVECTGRTVDALTIIRAQEDTSGVVHANGSQVAMLLTGGIINRLAEGSVRTATVVVAASNSLNKDAADYICTGTDDPAVIGAAQGTGNRLIHLMAGTYHGRFYIDQPNIVLEGEGMYNTILRLPDGIDVQAQTLTIVNDYVTVRNLQIDGNEDNQTNAGAEEWGRCDGIGAYGDHITIEHCYVRDMLSHGIIFWTESTSEHFGAPNASRTARDRNRYNNVRFCRVENAGNPTHTSQSIDSAYHTEFFHVIGNRVYGNGLYSCGVGYHGGRSDVIADNTIRNTVVGAININEGNDISIIGNTIKEVDDHGIHVYNRSSDITIVGNTIVDVTGNVGGAAIDIVGTSSTRCTDVMIADNIIRGTEAHGANLTFVDHIDFRNNHIKDINRCGIISGASTDITITGNTIRNFGLTTDRWGIYAYNAGAYLTGDMDILNNKIDGGITGINGVYIQSDSTNCVVKNNRVANVSGDALLFDAPANVICRGNKGWITENSGTDTLAAGGTTKAVTHGLDVTPVAGDIMITPLGSLLNATEFYISAYTDTTFTITVDADPGGAGILFAWQAAVL